MKRHSSHTSDEKHLDHAPKQKKRVTFQSGSGHSSSEQGKQGGENGSGAKYSWTTLATKKWTTAVKPGLSKGASASLVDLQKRDALSLSLDVKTLFEYLNSSEDDALEIGLAAFEHRIEKEHQLRLAHEARAAAALTPKPQQQPGKEGQKETDQAPLAPLPETFLLQQYLEKSPEVNELFSVLNICIKKDKTKSTMATMLLASFAGILKFNNWSHLQYISSNIARTFNKSHIHMCTSNLGSDQPLLVNATLDLLTGIVSVSQYHARDLFTAFNWSQKSFFNLVDKKNASYEGRKTDNQASQASSKSSTSDSKPSSSNSSTEYQSLYLLDVRTHYIRFGLAFLAHDDASLTQDVLGISGFLNGIFKEMQYDATALILQVFETLHEHVLLNKSVSKTSKTHFFTSWVLSQIAVVYKRFTILKDPSKALGALASLTRRRIQAFLESLLSSPTEGIIYLDLPKPFPPSARLIPANEELALSATHSGPSSSAIASASGTGSGSQLQTLNRNISKFVNILQPQDSQWHENLVLKILGKDIRLRKHYFENLKLSIEPRPTSLWLNNVTFVMKLLDVRPLELESLVTSTKDESSEFSFEQLLGWFIPICGLQRTYLSAGIRHANPSVRFATINLIHRILSALDDLSTAFTDELGSAPQGSTLLHQLLEGISNTIKRKIPDLDSVLILFNSGFTTTAAPTTPAPVKGSVQAAIDPKLKDFNLDVDDDMLHSQIMMLMSAYLRRFPESFVELNFDMGKLFAISDPWSSSVRVQEGMVPMFEATTSRLKWNSPLPSAAKSAKTNSTQLGYLLRFAIFVSEKPIKARVLRICHQLLTNSGLFDRCQGEIDIWLECLVSNPYESCIAYFESALAYLSQSPHFWAAEMTRQVQATDREELQSLWRQPLFPSSSTYLPFSLLALSIIKDHAHILVSTLGGIEATKTRLLDANFQLELTVVSEFLVSSLLAILMSSEIPLPMIHTIVSSATSPTQLPSFDTGRGKTEPLPEEILKIQSFGSLFWNFRGFLFKIHSVLPSAAHLPLGHPLDLPPTSPWSFARLNLHESIFSEDSQFLGAIGDETWWIDDQVMPWTSLGAEFFVAHLFSAQLREFLVNEQFIRLAFIRLAANPETIVASVRTLLFFVSTFLQNEHAGGCLRFALEMLSKLFSQALEMEGGLNTSGSSSSTSTQNSEDSAAPLPSKKSKKTQSNNEVAAKILRLILGNVSLNRHFLRDQESEAARSLSQIIVQLLESVIVQSAHHLVDEVKHLAATPLTKLVTVFASSLAKKKVSPSVLHCISLVRSVSYFMSPQAYQSVISTILSVDPKYLLSEEGFPLLELLAQLMLIQPASASPNLDATVFNLTVPCFSLESPPTKIDHLIHTPLVPEGRVTGAVFRAPLCELSTFASLVGILQQAAQRTSKLSSATSTLVSSLDQIVFRLLLASSTTALGSGSSAKSSGISIGDLDTFDKCGAPCILPDYGLQVDSSLVEELLKSCKKTFELDSSEAPEGEIPCLHRAAICAFNIRDTIASSTYQRLLSKISKCDSFSEISLKKKDVLEDISEGSKSFFKKLDKARSAHANEWFMLILLSAHANTLQDTQLEQLGAAFKPFFNISIATVFHLMSLSPSDAPDPLSQLITQIAVPQICRLITHARFTIIEEKDLKQMCMTIIGIAGLKDFSLGHLQIQMLRTLLMANDDPRELGGLLVKQAAAALKVLAETSQELNSSSQSTPNEFETAQTKAKDLANSTASKLAMLIVEEHLVPLIVPINTDSEDSEMSSLFRRMLRFGFEFGGVLRWILKAVQAQPVKSLITELHDLLVSHPSFIKLLFPQQNEGPSSILLTQESGSNPSETFISGGSIALLQLLCFIYEKNSDSTTMFPPRMLALYLSAYGATLSPTDQLLLHIIMIFEGKGISFSQAGFLWGTTAQTYKATAVAPTLTSSSNDMDVDSSGDEEETKKAKIPHVELETFHSLLFGGQLTKHRQMLTTIRSFSPRLTLSTSGQYLKVDTLWPGNTHFQTPSPSGVYDARYLLRIYMFGMNFFSDFDSKKFIEVGGLSLVFQSLAAFDLDLRQLGYSVLATFSALLDKATTPMREATQIRVLLSVLQAAIAIENLQLSSITTSFLGETSMILVRPSHPLFLELHNYLLSRPSLDLNSTPVWKRFLLSSRTTSKIEREWVLRMVNCGLRSPPDLSLLGLRHGGAKVTNTHTLGTIISHLGSNMPSSFSAISERRSLWSILAKLISNDAPAYKNTLLGPGGIVPFLSLWTSSHYAEDGLLPIPSAAAPSPSVYAEVCTVLRAISRLPELATLAKSRPLWLQFQPLISNILQFLHLSYAKLGSLNQQSTISASKNEDEDEDEEISSNSDSLHHNLYWRLLSPCIILLYHFATNLTLPCLSSVSMLKLAVELLAIIGGPYRPTCPCHPLLSLVASTTNSSYASSAMDITLTESQCLKASRIVAPIVNCRRSNGDLQIAQHYLMLAHTIACEQPDETNMASAKEWAKLTEFALRIVLSASSNHGSAGGQTLKTLIGRLVVICSTSSKAIILKKLTHTPAQEGSLLNTILFAFRQQLENSSAVPANDDFITVVLLNTLCTLLVAKLVRKEIPESWRNFFSGAAWSSLLGSVRTLSTNTLNDSAQKQLCENMDEKERLNHLRLAKVFRGFLSGSQPESLHLGN